MGRALYSCSCRASAPTKGPAKTGLPPCSSSAAISATSLAQWKDWPLCRDPRPVCALYRNRVSTQHYVCITAGLRVLFRSSRTDVVGAESVMAAQSSESGSWKVGDSTYSSYRRFGRGKEPCEDAGRRGTSAGFGRLPSVRPAAGFAAAIVSFSDNFDFYVFFVRSEHRSTALESRQCTWLMPFS